MSKNCEKCNYENEDHGNFCQGCGASLTQPPVQEASQAGPLVPPIPNPEMPPVPPVSTAGAPPAFPNSDISSVPPAPPVDEPSVLSDTPVSPVSAADAPPMLPDNAVPPVPPQPQAAPVQQTSAQDVESNKFIAALAYFVFFLPMLVCKESVFARFHANQALVLLLAWIVVMISGSIIPILGWFLILPIGSIVIIVLGIMGIINALNGQMKELPLIGKIVLLS